MADVGSNVPTQYLLGPAPPPEPLNPCGHRIEVGLGRLALESVAELIIGEIAPTLELSEFLEVEVLTIGQQDLLNLGQLCYTGFVLGCG